MPARRFLRLAALAAPLTLPFAAWSDDPPADSKSGARPELKSEGKPPEQLFKELDKNGDGKLTAAEIPDDSRSLFDHLLRIGDKDKNGELTEREFTEGVKPPERRPAPGSPGRGEDRPEPGRMFQRWDRNGDGKLTLEELPDPARERLKPLFDRLGKSEISREEFIRARERARPEGGLPGNAAELLKRADRNGDGKLTLDEVPEMLRPRLREHLEKSGKGPDAALSLDEVRNLIERARADGPIERMRDRADGRGPAFFRKLDSNGDGKLNKDELQNAARLFDELDSDKDGSLDLRELMGRPVDRRPEAPPPSGEKAAVDRDAPAAAVASTPKADSPPAIPVKAPKKGFKPLQRFDTDGDGKLSRDESPARVRKQFDRFDENRDGYLERGELLKALREVKAKKPAEANA